MHDNIYYKTQLIDIIQKIKSTDALIYLYILAIDIAKEDKNNKSEQN